jgi:hypothetical protein
MGEKSFWENLANVPKDAMREMKGMFKAKEKPAADSAAQAEAASRRAAAEKADREQSERRAAEVRAEIDALFDGPGPSEVGAKILYPVDRSPVQPSLRETKLDQEIFKWQQAINAARDPSTKRHAELQHARLLRQREERRAA